MTKYRNKKQEYKGMVFDSGRELKRYKDLELMERAGEISDLKCQVSFELVPKCKKNRAAHYIADFVYLDENGNRVVEDTKGYRTQKYILQKKLMLWRYGIEIREI